LIAPARVAKVQCHQYPVILFARPPLPFITGGLPFNVLIDIILIGWLSLAVLWLASERTTPAAIGDTTMVLSELRITVGVPLFDLIACGDAPGTRPLGVG
jgi:hypothetical protein